MKRERLLSVFCVDATNQATQLRLDAVEIAVVDYERLAPWLADQFSRWLTVADDSPVGVDQVPLTFAQGLPAIYSRPGEPCVAGFDGRRKISYRALQLD